MNLYIRPNRTLTLLKSGRSLSRTASLVLSACPADELLCAPTIPCRLPSEPSTHKKKKQKTVRGLMPSIVREQFRAVADLVPSMDMYVVVSHDSETNRHTRTEGRPWNAGKQGIPRYPRAGGLDNTYDGGETSVPIIRSTVCRGILHRCRPASCIEVSVPVFHPFSILEQPAIDPASETPPTEKTDIEHGPCAVYYNNNKHDHTQQVRRTNAEYVSSPHQ